MNRKPLGRLIGAFKTVSTNKLLQTLAVRYDLRRPPAERKLR
jgi:hypothetical protein